MLNVATASPIRRSDAATTQTPDKKSVKITYDNILYLSGFTGHLPAPDRRTVRNLNKSTIARFVEPDILRGGGRCFGHARNFSPVPAESRRVRRSIAAFIAYLGRAAIARLIDLLAAICRAVAPPVESDYRWQGDTNVYPFPSSEVYEAPLTPGQKRAAKSLAKQLNQEAPMVIQHPTADILPNSHTLPVAPNGTRVWASASPTPGLSNVIDTKREAETLAAARKNNSPYLIGPSARWNGAH